MSPTGRYARRPRHARPTARSRFRTSLLLTLAGGAAVATSGTAHAVSGVAESIEAVGHATAPVTELQLYPLGGTGVDVLSNGVETSVADFQPADTTEVTGPISEDSSLAGLTRHASGLLGAG